MLSIKSLLIKTHIDLYLDYANGFSGSDIMGLKWCVLQMKLGKYQHSKTGNYYRVIAIAKHSETLEEFVVYEALYKNPKSKFWIRPMKMFFEEVEINGKKVHRFKFISE